MSNVDGGGCDDQSVVSVRLRRWSRRRCIERKWDDRGLRQLFESVFIDDSFACRIGKGNRAAVQRAQEFAGRFEYFLKLDVRKFFETMDHGVLKARLEELVDDEKIRWLAGLFVDKGAPGSPDGKGQPIGNLTSQQSENVLAP